MLGVNHGTQNGIQPVNTAFAAQVFLPVLALNVPLAPRHKLSGLPDVLDSVDGFWRRSGLTNFEKQKLQNSKKMLPLVNADRLASRREGCRTLRTAYLGRIDAMNFCRWNLVSALWARRGERSFHFFEIDLFPGGHSKP